MRWNELSDPFLCNQLTWIDMGIKTQLIGSIYCFTFVYYFLFLFTPEICIFVMIMLVIGIILGDTYYDTCRFDHFSCCSCNCKYSISHSDERHMRFVVSLPLNTAQGSTHGQRLMEHSPRFPCRGILQCW